MPTPLTPRSFAKMTEASNEDEGRTLSKLSESRRKLYQRTRREIKERTENKFTEQEYHHLTMLYLLLDDADAYIESAGGPQNVDPELLNQIRLMRDSFLARLKEAREEQKTVGSILKEAKEAMLKLRDKHGNQTTIIKTEDSESLITLIENELNKKTDESKKATEDEQTEQKTEGQVETKNES